MIPTLQNLTLRSSMSRTAEILLAEDSEYDVMLAEAAFRAARTANRLWVVHDGQEALDFLYRRQRWKAAPQPDLILLDVSLPRVDGRQVLSEVKSDPNLRRIPVVVMTTSADQTDIRQIYDLQANSYIVKPMDPDRAEVVFRVIEEFWLSVARLPEP